jgi:hypothetical protein
MLSPCQKADYYFLGKERSVYGGTSETRLLQIHDCIVKNQETT